MAEQEYFKRALSDFTFDVAGGGRIRRLAEKGYTVKQIRDALDYPIPYEKVRWTVWEYLLERQVLLLEKPGKSIHKQRTVYVEERGKFGKKSFRQVAIPAEDGGQIQWREVSCGDSREILSMDTFLLSGRHKETELIHLLAEKCGGAAAKTVYVSCDYGILMQKEPKQFAALLDVLEERQKEYIEGLPWVNQRVYHCMDQRMLEIVRRQLQTGRFHGSCYFSS